MSVPLPDLFSRPERGSGGAALCNYLPRRYDDEALFSWLARWQSHTGLQSSKRLLRALFASSNTRIGLQLQGKLASLSQWLPYTDQFSPEHLALETTEFPYHSAFCSQSVRQDALRALIDGEYGWVQTRLGLAAFSIQPPARLKLCPTCVSEDLKANGETYWRRAHQLPGVIVCHLHACPLRETGTQRGKIKQHALPLAEPDHALGPQETPRWVRDRRAHRLLHEFARRSEALLRQAGGASEDTNDFSRDYRSQLVRKGLGRGSAQIDQLALGAAYEDYVAPITAILPEISIGPWLQAITRKHRKAFSPLQHIIFQMFLESLDDGVGDQASGNGPWRCLNPLEPHFGNQVVEEMSTHREAGKLIGVFSCACGYQYSQAVEGGRAVVRSFGRTFDALLTEAVNAGRSLRATAKLLHVDPKTVARHSLRLGLQTSWKQPELPEQSLSDQIDARRQRWRAHVASNSALSMTGLRLSSPADWTWLSRNDRDWLQLSVTKITPTATRGPRYDWNTRDQKLSQQTFAAMESLRDARPPVRITVHAIERQLGKPGYFRSRWSKLPMTMQLIGQGAETIEQFQCRRVLISAEKLSSQGIPVVGWRIRRAAGLGASITAAAAALIEQLEKGVRVAAAG